MNSIYGIQLDQPITPLIVRDAISECFFQAHCEDSEIGGNKEISRTYCQSLVKKIFTDSRSNYENPTKQDLLQVIKALQDFSANFRNQKIIQKHASQIMTLIDKISE